MASLSNDPTQQIEEEDYDYDRDEEQGENGNVEDHAKQESS
jgi:hypothetical protein